MSSRTLPRATLAEFWNQRGGIALAAIEGDHLKSAKKIVCIPGYDDSAVRVGSLIASPANVVDKLCRRERGPSSKVSGVFHNDGWTVIIEELGGMVTSQPREALRIAKLCKARVITASCEDEDRCIGLIVASPKRIESAGYSSATGRGDNPRPRDAKVGSFKPHPLTYGDPTPGKLRSVLKEFGFDPARHVLNEREITTVFRKTRSKAFYDPTI